MEEATSDKKDDIVQKPFEVKDEITESKKEEQNEVKEEKLEVTIPVDEPLILDDQIFTGESTK